MLWREWWQLGCIFLVTSSTPCSAQSNAMNEWKRQIVIRLQSHKHFPLGGRGESGEAIVRFRLDRNGKVTLSKILKSTGSAPLDQAALEMVESAQPFPPAPPDIGDKDLSFIAPVVFVGPKPYDQAGDPGEAKVRESIRGICRGC